MKKTTIKKCEAKLLAMREEIVSTIKTKAKNEFTIDSNVQDEGDIAQDSNAKNLAMVLADKDAGKLKQIDAALARIKDGTFGFCVDTDEEIEEKRLLANPLALRTIEAQESFERSAQRMGGDSSGARKMFGSDDD